MLKKLPSQIDGAIDSTTVLGQQVMERDVLMGGVPADDMVDGPKQIYATRDNRYFYPSDEWLMGHKLPVVA